MSGAGACEKEAPPPAGATPAAAPVATPPAPVAKPPPSPERARLDEALRLASEGKYDGTVAIFEEMKAKQPDAITALDGLKLVVVYAEMGNAAKYDELTRWLVARHRKPARATDAERSVKGYIVHRRATDPALLAHAVEMTRFAGERAAADGEGQYQGFFDTSRGVAAYRVGRHAEAAKWLATTIEHESLYVRTLALPFYAMATLAQGNRADAQPLLARARTAARDLPKPGTEEYSIEWTDILISHMALAEAESAFAKAGK
jgi:tetratricopeptide (TPR) repeat protein